MTPSPSRLALAVVALAACTAPSSPAAPSGLGSSTGDEYGDSTGADRELPSGWSRWISPAEDNDIGQVRMLDAQRGFVTAFGSASHADLAGLYRTDDGGLGWVPVRQGIDVLDVAWADDGRTLWLVGSGREAWVKTTDGGQSFAPMDESASDFFAHVAFFDTQDGVAASETGDRIWVTHDGGISWASTAFGRGLVPGVNRLVLHGDHVFCVSGPDFDADGTGAVIVHSSDRGRTWDPPTVLDDGAHDRRGGGLWGLAVVDERELWVAGRNRQIFHTTDAMRTWEQIVDVPAPIEHFIAIDRHDRHIVAIGITTPATARLFESFDAGQTWSLGDEVVADAQLRSGGFGPDGKLFLYGLQGVILVKDAE